jgi:hypothetical protein
MTVQMPNGPPYIQSAGDWYTVKKVIVFPVPSGDVTNQTLFLAGNSSIIPGQGEFGK